jgi:hypothetical protein
LKVVIATTALTLLGACAQEEADQPSVAPAAKGASKTATTTAGSKTPTTKPATAKPGGPSTTEVPAQRLPGTPIAPPPVAPGTDISSDDLASFVPGAILTKIADTPDVEVRFTTDERDRRADTDTAVM